LKACRAQAKRAGRVDREALPQRLVDHLAERLALAPGLTLGALQQVVGNLNGRLHMGNHNMMYGYPAMSLRLFEPFCDAGHT
jgi:hypothetical protein